MYRNYTTYEIFPGHQVYTVTRKVTFPDGQSAMLTFSVVATDSFKVDEIINGYIADQFEYNWQTKPIHDIVIPMLIGRE